MSHEFKAAGRQKFYIPSAADAGGKNATIMIFCHFFRSVTDVRWGPHEKTVYSVSQGNLFCAFVGAPILVSSQTCISKLF